MLSNQAKFDILIDGAINDKSEIDKLCKEFYLINTKLHKHKFA